MSNFPLNAQIKPVELTEDETKIMCLFKNICLRMKQLPSPPADLLGKTGPQDCRYVWVAGGFVRDKLMGEPSKDVDIIIPYGQSLAVLATVKDECQKAGFEFKVQREPKAIGQGICHDLKLSRFEVTIPDQKFEIDMRECARDGVPYQTDPKSRDFTVNAGYFDPLERSAIDPEIGLFKDLASKTLRTVITPDETFSPDPSRMIRAVRFSVTRGFTFEPILMKYIKENGSNLMVNTVLTQNKDNSSRNMTNPEYFKIFSSDKHFPRLVYHLWDLKLLPQVASHVVPRSEDLEYFKDIEAAVPKDWPDVDKARYRSVRTGLRIFTGIDNMSETVLCVKLSAFLKLTARIHFSERSGKHQHEYYVRRWLT